MRRDAHLWLATAAALAMVECLVLSRLGPGMAWPSLTFVLVGALAVRAADRRRGREEDLVAICFGIGLIKDLFTAGPLGGNAFIFVMAAVAFIALRRRFYVWNPLIWGAAGFGLFFSGHLLEGVAVGLAEPGMPLGRMVSVSLSAALAETALMPVALLSFRKYKVSLRGS